MRRIKPALYASAKHLTASAIVALCSAFLVFFVWYPYPYNKLAGGVELFLILMAVDVVCGPLLTLIVYNPSKQRTVLWRDIVVILCLQLAALSYGLYSLMQARPVFLAFEIDRFRVVSVPDVQNEEINLAPKNLAAFSLLGPKLIAIKKLEPTDPKYILSIQSAVNGMHPAFFPSRWMDYSEQKKNVIDTALPLNVLRANHKKEEILIDKLVNKISLKEADIGYIPLVSNKSLEWVVLISLITGDPVGYLPLDGWMQASTAIKK